MYILKKNSNLFGQKKEMQLMIHPIFHCNAMLIMARLSSFLTILFDSLSVIKLNILFDYINLCNSPGTMVRKLPAYITEILLEKGVK
jgi:hypothetical protein